VRYSGEFTRVSSPVFSIVVPTFRRPEALRALLKALAASRFPLDRMEVILVDDSGSDDLEAVLAPFRQCFALTALCTPHLGPAPARQAGIDRAQGEFLAFTDDDCIPEEDWLGELQAALEKHPGCAIGGAVRNGLPGNVFSSVTQIIFDYIVQPQADQEVEFVGTGNVAYPAAAFREIGGLDRSWQISGAEDRDLCRRWRASGRRFVQHPAAAIRHYHPLTWRKFLDQHFRYGKGSGRFHRESSLPRSGFYTGLIAAGFAGDGFHPRLFTGGLLLLAQLATACGFATERMFPRRG
jgi:GT2 family glycosyltransferase